MNEQRRFYKQKFGAPKANQKQETSEYLLESVVSFIDKNRTIAPCDWVTLDGIIKQLENGKSNHPKKVLKAMERSFENIKSFYENQR